MAFDITERLERAKKAPQFQQNFMITEEQREILKKYFRIAGKSKNALFAEFLEFLSEKYKAE